MEYKENVVAAIHHLKLASEYFDDFIRENKGSFGERILSGYVKRINWIYNDFVANPKFTDEVRNGIKQEWESDVLSIPAINGKISLLNPSQRETIELIVDSILSGEEVVVKDKSEINY